jgi:putative CocE/NonD family hydrolase
MKSAYYLVATLAALPCLLAQKPTPGIDGIWQGALLFGQGKIRTVFYFSSSSSSGREGAYKGALVNLESGAGSSIDSITLSDGKLGLELKSLGFKFEGTLAPTGDEIRGKFTQGDTTGDLTLTRSSQSGSDAAASYQKHDYMIPMRDGIHLHTIVFSPKAHSAALPFLIERSPYGWDGAEVDINAGMSELARDGYFLVFQDIRGRYGSEGQFVLQRPVRNAKDNRSIDEGTDTYDTIDWLLKNIPGNNGRAGIMGISYGGWLTEMALIEPHPALKAASEQASPSDMFLGDDFHHNGAFRLSYGFEYAAMMETGKTNKTFEFKQFDTYDWYLKLGPLSQANARYFDGQRPTWNNFIAHPDYDNFWKGQAVQRIVRSVKVPNLNVGGWFDQEDFAGPWRIFAASETPEARQYNYMVEGPWNHGGWFSGPGRTLKNLDFGSNTGDYFRENIQARWFAYWLKDQGPLNLARIELFQTGSNQWKSYDQWPPSGVQEKRLYLHAGSEASFEPPAEGADPGEAFDSYVSDPHRPVPYRERPIPETYGGSPGWSTWHADDQRFAESRPDVAVWQTKPLEADVTVAGDVIADLFASTSGTDADWVVKLIDAYPESVPQDPAMGGYELMIGADVLRGRFRNGFEQPQPVKPNEAVEYRVDLLSHDHVFKKGHRIMIQVQSTWFPIIDRNPQKFVPNIFEAKEQDFQAATQHVFRSKMHASAVILPVVP